VAPNSPGLNPVIMLLRVPFSNESIADKFKHGGRTEESDNHRVATFH